MLNDKYVKIGFGGGCHWCTEAVFQSVKGVNKVEQGWIASEGENNYFSEAVIVHYEPHKIDLAILIEIHLLTHSSTSNHLMRNKYRSAVYYFSKNQEEQINQIIAGLQPDFDYKIITGVYPFVSFKPSREELQNYYRKNPNKPFCQKYIEPKLSLILDKYTEDIIAK